MSTLPNITVRSSGYERLETRRCTGIVHLPTGPVSRTFTGRDAYGLAYEWARERRRLELAGDGEPE